MSADPAHPGRSPLGDLRDAVRQMLGADRRLRRRSQGAAEGEPTYAQLLTLAVLDREQGLTAGETARMAGLDPGSLTAVLDQLESSGVIVRTRNPANRRAYVISLTEHGHELADRSLERWHGSWDAHLAQFSDADLAVAARVIGALAEVFDSLPSCAAAARPQR